ncbi:esterase-like activity of phytase family protein [Brevundimonas sp.]|uniref:esterase-like activity of phytase family protein n=1 Tax=Brevundimonas sp. TaxID=1871086 RepID=UPI002D306BA8|nr:esterase-like activity of phytase family protein [Brevundimonas sp.]HYD28328.1 esterase-like activity of phytase family protein [Brevundimonas sp.]
MRRLAPFAACVLLLSACAGAAVIAPAAPYASHGWTPLAVETRRVGLGIPGGVRLSPGVRFAGGLEILAPPGDRLHGLSDLKLLDGEVLMVSDAGDLFRARLQFDARGRPSGLSDLRVRALTAEDGRAFSAKPDGDAEALAITADDGLIVGFEQRPRLWSYGSPDDIRERPRAFATPPVPGGNEGIEALAAEPDGWRVAGESGGVWDCRPRACVAVGEPPATPIPVSGWRITGMDGDPARAAWFVVQRRFRAPVDMRARLRRMAEDGTFGPVLVELSLPSTVDNFEGIAAVRHGDGVRLYILSDDNSHARQRTLLLAFDVGAGAQVVRKSSPGGEAASRPRRVR